MYLFNKLCNFYFFFFSWKLGGTGNVVAADFFDFNFCDFIWLIIIIIIIIISIHFICFIIASSF